LENGEIEDENDSIAGVNVVGLRCLTISLSHAWAPALGGQGGRVPTLEIIWVGIAHPKFPSLEIV